MRRGRVLVLLLYDEWNTLKRLVNKPQNVVFLYTQELSLSVFKVQSTRKSALKPFLQDTCDKHLPKFIMRIFINLLLSTNTSTEVLLRLYVKIKAPSAFINVSIVILPLFCLTLWLCSGQIDPKKIFFFPKILVNVIALDSNLLTLFT